MSAATTATKVAGVAKRTLPGRRHHLLPCHRLCAQPKSINHLQYRTFFTTANPPAGLSSEFSSSIGEPFDRSLFVESEGGSTTTAGVQVTEIDSETKLSNNNKKRAPKATWQFTEIVSRLIKLRRHQEALYVYRKFREMKGSVWDLPAYTTAMALHNDILDYATTLSIWEEVKANALVPDLRAYSAVMEAACALRDDVFARRLLHDSLAGSVAPDPLLFSMVLDIYVELRQLDRARQLLTVMKETSVQFIPSIYSSIIKLYFHERRIEAMLGVPAEMEKAGVKPDQTVYACLMDYLLNINHVKEAREVLNTLMLSGMPPTASTFRVIIRLYQKEGNASAAESIYFGLLFRPSIEISPDIFNAMIEMNVKRQDFAAVEQVLQAMKNRRVVPNVGTFDLLINMYATQGDYKRAIAAAHEMASCGLLADQSVIASLIKVYSVSHDIDSIDYIVETMEKRGMRHTEQSYVALLTAYFEAGEIDKAYALVTKEVTRVDLQMSPLGQLVFIKVLGFPFTDDALYEIMTACINCKAYNAAFDYWSAITSPPRNVKPSIGSYARRLELYEHAGISQVDNALELIAHVINLSGKGQLPITREFTRMVVKYLVAQGIIGRVAQLMALSKYAVWTGDHLKPEAAKSFAADFQYWRKSWERARKWKTEAHEPPPSSSASSSSSS